MNPNFGNQIGTTWDEIGTVLGRLFLGQISFSGDFWRFTMIGRDNVKKTWPLVAQNEAPDSQNERNEKNEQFF